MLVFQRLGPNVSISRLRFGKNLPRPDTVDNDDGHWRPTDVNVVASLLALKKKRKKEKEKKKRGDSSRP